MIGITARSLLLAVFWLGASCPLAASQLSAAKRVTAQQFGYDHTWRGPGTQGRPDQLFRRGLGSRSGFSEQAYSGRCYHCLSNDQILLIGERCAGGPDTWSKQDRG
jgi:hypothetical protein